MYTDWQSNTGLSDLELVTRVKNGDPLAFSVLSDRYMPVLLTRVRRYAGIVGVDVEDFMQEGMFALFRAAKGFDPDASASFGTYAVACIYNSMTDAIRAHMKEANRREHVHVEDIDEGSRRIPILSSSSQHVPEDMLLERETRTYRSRQIEALLSDFECKVLKLYLADHSYHKISYVLGTTAKSVDNALQRVRRKLRQKS